MKKFISGLIFGIFLPIFIIPLLDSTAQYLINAIAIKSSKEIKDANLDEQEEEFLAPQIGFSIENNPIDEDDDEDKGE